MWQRFVALRSLPVSAAENRLNLLINWQENAEAPRLKVLPAFGQLARLFQY
jgi:hypothetical protein